MGEDRRLISSETDLQIEEMRRFALGALCASSSVFYWISEAMEMVDAIPSGTSRRTFPIYMRHMKSYDPLNVHRLAGSGKRVSTLRDDHILAPPPEYAQYRGYLRESAIVDVLDFVFWDGDRPFAGLGIIKNPCDPPFRDESFAFAKSMQPYMEFTLASHPRQQRQRQLRELGLRFGLTPREIEITKLVAQGLTNQDLAEALDIGLGTVKTHLTRVFIKLGIENRASVPSRIARIGLN